MRNYQHFYKFIIVMSVIFTLVILPVEVMAGPVEVNDNNVQLINVEDVELVSEEVAITYIGEGLVTAKIKYTLHNIGSANNVKIGYPASYEVTPYPKSIGLFIGEISEFSAKQNNAQLDTYIVKGEVSFGWSSDSQDWYISEIEIDADETLEILFEYSMQLPGSETYGYFMCYPLELSAGWNGKINHSVISFNLPSVSPYSIKWLYKDFHEELLDYPLAFLSYDDDKLVYERADYEPNGNLELWFYGADSTDYSGQEFFGNVKDLTEEQLIDLYDSINSDQMRPKMIEAMYIKKAIQTSNDNPPEVISLQLGTPYYTVVDIKDIDYDTYKNCKLIVRDKDSGVIDEVTLGYRYIFTEYGVSLYWIMEDFNMGDEDSIYEVIVSDYMGNETTAYFKRIEGTMKTYSYNPLDTENPQTKASDFQHYQVLAMLLIGLGLLLLRERLRMRWD